MTIDMEILYDRLNELIPEDVDYRKVVLSARDVFPTTDKDVLEELGKHMPEYIENRHPGSGLIVRYDDLGVAEIVYDPRRNMELDRRRISTISNDTTGNIELTRELVTRAKNYR